MAMSDCYSKSKISRLKAFKDKVYPLGRHSNVEFYPWFERDSDDIGGVTIDGTLDVEELTELIAVISEVNKM